MSPFAVSLLVLPESPCAFALRTLGRAIESSLAPQKKPSALSRSAGAKAMVFGSNDLAECNQK
jgi:hypothetical protein